jgi:hypothetical protein
VKARKTTHYRLKQVDYNQEFAYSDIVILSPSSEYDFTVYPNPSKGIVNILDESNEIRKVDIVNIQGANVHSTLSDFSKIQLNVKTGIYWILITTRNGEVVRKSLVME